MHNIEPDSEENEKKNYKKFKFASNSNNIKFAISTKTQITQITQIKTSTTVSMEILPSKTTNNNRNSSELNSSSSSSKTTITSSSKTTITSSSSSSFCSSCSATNIDYLQNYGTFIKIFFFDKQATDYINFLINKNEASEKEFFMLQDYIMLLFCVLNAQRGEMIKKLLLTQFMSREKKFSNLQNDKVDEYSDYISIYFPKNKTCNLNQFIGCTTHLEKLILKLIYFRAQLFPNFQNEFLFINKNGNTIKDLNFIWKRYLKQFFNQKSKISSFHKIRHIAVSSAVKHNINLKQNLNDFLIDSNVKHLSTAMGHSAKTALKLYTFDQTKIQMHYESWCALRQLEKIS